VKAIARGESAPLVIFGDSLLDWDITGETRRLSPEAPVPVVSGVCDHYRPGGAALAALLAAQDGHRAILVTALSQDADGARLRAMLDNSGVEVIDLRLFGPTPVKLRVRSADRSLIMVDRADEVAPVGAIPKEASDAIVGAGAILVADYGRGLTALAEARVALGLAASGAPVVWDPHPRGSPPVESIKMATPNCSEAEIFAVGVRGEGLQADIARARYLMLQWRVQSVVVTRGKAGAALVHDSIAPAVVVQPEDRVVRDTCGAGDRFAVTATALLRAGAPFAEVVAASVAAASHFAEIGGSSSVLADPPIPTASAESPVQFARRIKQRGGIVVAAGGCFDLLHTGHLSLLRQARQLGDCLIVLLNSDSSVMRIKGPSRPIMKAADRAALVKSLDCVDEVMIFEEDTPISILNIIKPDVYVKGDDYRIEDLPEAEAISGWGGTVVLVPRLPDYSTTGLIEQATSLAPPISGRRDAGNARHGARPRS
jgi:D-beta-D-heptose 7-phosphate kinase / D-beta-D-heptose 1-phosphate adenosyltransferase